MPTNSVNDGDAKVNRYSRLSASQANMWSACPRMWYYSKVERLVSDRPPILFMGTAVENTICRILKESPALITSNAGINVMRSPLDLEGRPDHGDIANWPGLKLIPLESNQIPTNVAELRLWAIDRATLHFEKCWDIARIEWRTDDNKSGDFEELDKEYSLQMIRNFIDMHLEEVDKCLEKYKECDLEKWRRGEHEICNYSPNGFSNRGGDVSQVANGLGENMSVCEAWEIVRPWFVDPSAKKFTQTSTIPEHWYQGEYDLVYRWFDRIHIVDIKASKGNNHRSEDYIQQLRYYAWMWWRCHDKNEIVEKLEVWYLGANTKKSIDTPDKDELIEIEEKLSQIYDRLFLKPRLIEDFPAEPSPIQIFMDGGKFVESDTKDYKSRCGVCDYKDVCTNSKYRKKLPEGGYYTGQGGVEYKLTATDKLKPRKNIAGKIFGLRLKMLNDKDAIDEFYLMQGSNMAKVYPIKDTEPRIPLNLYNDLSIRIAGALPVIRRKKLELQIDDNSEITVTQDAGDDDVSLLGFNTTVNLHCEIFSFNHWSGPNNRGGITRKFGMTVIDNKGSISVLAWNNGIPEISSSLKKGDEIVITNAELGEYNGRTQLTLNWNSRVHILH